MLGPPPPSRQPRPCTGCETRDVEVVPVGTAPARSADRAVGAVVAVVAVLLLVGSGRFVAASLVVVTAVAVLQARSLSPRVDRAIGHGIVAVGHAVGRVLSFVLLGALFLVVIVPVWLVGMPFRRRPLGVPRGVHGWVPRTATEAGAGVGVGADEGGDRVAPAVERRAARRAHGHEPGRAPVPWRRALGRVALVALVLLALDLALGAVLSVTGLAPGEEAAFREGQRWIVDTMDSPAARDEPWAEQYTEDSLDLFARQQDYVPYLLYGFQPFTSRYVNLTDRERRSYEPEVPAGERPLRVAFFGGSVTFGIGQRDDHTIASEFARLAEAAGVPVEVHNYGMYGWVAWQEYGYFERLLAAGERYDLAVFYDGLNDVSVQQSDFSVDPTHGGSQIMRHLSGEIHDRYYRAPGPLDGVTDLARAYRANSGLAHVVDRLTREEGAMPSWMRTDPVEPSAATAAALDVLARSHTAVADLGARHDVPVRFVFQPQRTGWDPTILDGLPAGTVDATGVYDGIGDEVYLDGAHTNERGARLAAEDLWRRFGPGLTERADPDGASG